MERRTKVAIGIVIVLLLALLAAVLYWWSSRRPAPTPVVNVPETAAPVNTRLPPTNGTPTTIANVATNEPAEQLPAPKADDQAAVKRLAMAFSERLGSYSSEGDFANIIDLLPLMTPSLQDAQNAFVAAQRAKSPSEPVFSGVTSRALNATFSSFDDAVGKASVTVQLQRRETSSTGPDDRVYYQDLRLELLKRSGKWAVDSVKWAEVSAPL